MRLAIICTIGLPGSGKTTFCQQNLSTLFPDVHMIHICYDTIEQLCGECARAHLVSSIDESETALTPYKLFRYRVIQIVDFVIHSLITRNKPTSSRPPFLPEILQQSVELGQYVTEILNRVPSDCGNICVVLDDNMYYRSMRYSFYQLARKYCVGFGQLHFDTPLSVCLAQNSLRSGDERIDEEVILKMNSRLEVPNIDEYQWEAHSLSIAARSSQQSSLPSFLMTCLCSPLHPVPDTEKEREESMRITAEHVVHQSDLILRQLVKLHIQSAKSAAGSIDMKQEAANANLRRRAVMSYINSHGNEFSSLLSQSTTRSSEGQQWSALQEMLQRLFNQQEMT